MFKVCFLKICRNQFIDSNVKLRENKTITFYTHQSFYLGFLNIYKKWKESITINRYFYLIITMDFREKWLCHLFQLPLSIVSVDWTNLSNLSLSLSVSLCPGLLFSLLRATSYTRGHSQTPEPGIIDNLSIHHQTREENKIHNI